jgi:hypothetical protein
VAGVREPDAFSQLLERARRARAAKEAADAEWAAVESELSSLADTGALTDEQQSALAELAAPEEAGAPTHHRRRWGPAPS